ncbi:DUF2946 family protein [Solimonas terrae]|uniref:DUF2946 family protein n=1 Tax=Solimonas terrae TaxID=1396819 RepID=A0A6M2BTU6_9GAMM|nr:DUF2946 family protein [Solimonas terrae]NGY05387.1 DUF2946 family protein [Solimonas terrae]
MSSVRRHRHTILLWLALLGVLYRALIPPGFMPVMTHTARGTVLGLAMCYGQGPVTIGQNPARSGDAGHTGHGADRQEPQCPFAAAATPALPYVASLSPAPAAAPARQQEPVVESAANDTANYLRPPSRAPPEQS